MRVLKFGGTSVGSPHAMTCVRDIIRATDDQLIVVVSALGGVTDALLEAARKAVAGDKTYTENLEAIVSRHFAHLSEVAGAEDTDTIGARMSVMLEELTNIFNGVFLIGDLSMKTTDTIVSYGERLSSLILSGMIKEARLVDSREFIKTRNYFGKHAIDFTVTDRLIREAFAGSPRVTIVPGFISSDVQNGNTTTLGRGGSDYTASVIAAALEAEVLEIWTDVDGFMTADPRVIASAYVIERLSFVEAIELCNFGAKVIYPPTIFPVYHKNIPIRVKNTFNPSHPGTYISNEHECDEDRPIKGISSVADTCLITIQGLGMVGVIGVNYRIFKALAKAGISVFLVSQAASENNTSIAVKESDADTAVEVLTKEFALEIGQGEIDHVIRECGLATVAIVGQHMKHMPGVAGKLFGTLGRNGINVIALAQGAQQTNVSFVIKIENLRKAMNVIHDSFFLSDYQVLNIFLAGVGLVGSSLIEQIRLQQNKLLEENSLQLRIVGITDSRRYITDRNGIDLGSYRKYLEEKGCDSSPEKFRDRILSMNIFNSVFVDCTASAGVSDIYGSLLQKNVSVVTANKIAASSSYQVYSSLKMAARQSGVKFLFDTNVGAGLPIINTISDLRNSGDKILKIEAVVSGTLNYIFNEMSERVTFSQAVRSAQQAGYAEPDPREDLSGMDALRKLVILSREAGYHIEKSDVEVSMFLPPQLFAGTLEQFWKGLQELDTEFEQRRARLQAMGLRERFVAVLDNGQASVGLRQVSDGSPFYELAGSNNVISITTERYREYPMQIKGYGAGAAVTAAGVFADIISIANIR